MGYCYLLHFENEATGEHKHYIGWAKDYEHLKERIYKHKNNIGAKWVRNSKNVRVVRLWKDATTQDERRLKTLVAERFCPLCSKYIPASVKGAHLRVE